MGRSKNVLVGVAPQTISRNSPELIENNPMSNITEILNSGGVMRYHAQPDIQCQSTAEHMWGVAVLLIKFYPDATANMIKAALVHDCGEVEVGDIPAPTKRAHPDLKKIIQSLEHHQLNTWELNFEIGLSAEELKKIKICDVLEGLWYTARQVQRTNMGHEVLIKWVEYARSLNLNQMQRSFIDATGAYHLLKGFI